MAQLKPNAEPLNLLIVDDDVLLRDSLSEIFRQFGHNVRTASDGFTGLAEIRHRMPDLLLSDLHMPGMSGFELLSVVRRRFPQIQVIAMSSAHAGEGIPLGVSADGYYEKAANFGLLLDLVVSKARRPRPTLRHTHAVSPVWVAKNGHDPRGDPFVTLTCPECLRNFAHILDEDSRQIHRTGCHHCHAELDFAIVQALEPVNVSTRSALIDPPT